MDIKNENIFKEYDIRGIFKDDFSSELIKKVGYFIGLEVKKVENSICVGFDCRSHSPQCFKWLISGLNKSGLKVINIGEVPTPVTYFSGYYDKTECMSNIMITASHNPKEYNGFKITIGNKSFFGEDIQFLKKQILDSDVEIEDNFDCESFDIVNPYINMVVEKFEHLKNYNKKVIVDCGNGMSGPTIKKIFDKLNLNYELMYETPDGEFPNHPADPSVRQNLNHLIKELNDCDVEIGFAHDGDSDRIYACLKSGPINPDILGVLIAKTLDNPKVIGEVKCSQVMYDEINKTGSTIMSKTGHSNIKKLIRENPDTNFAIELSGHVFFKDRYFGYDDAIYTTFRVIELEKNGFDFEYEIKKLPQTFSTSEIKITVDENKKFEVVEEFIQKVKNNKDELNYVDLIDIDGLRINFENGWGLVRASNTSPVLVTRFESSSESDLEKIKSKVMSILNTII
jgi:phosphomannomutase/phosphoglucomutase